MGDSMRVLACMLALSSAGCLGFGGGSGPIDAGMTGDGDGDGDGNGDGDGDGDRGGDGDGDGYDDGDGSGGSGGGIYAVGAPCPQGQLVACQCAQGLGSSRCSAGTVAGCLCPSDGTGAVVRAPEALASRYRSRPLRGRDRYRLLVP